jgi:hypothetical protein
MHLESNTFSNPFTLTTTQRVAGGKSPFNRTRSAKFTGIIVGAVIGLLALIAILAVINFVLRKTPNTEDEDGSAPLESSEFVIESLAESMGSFEQEARYISQEQFEQSADHTILWQAVADEAAFTI